MSKLKLPLFILLLCIVSCKDSSPTNTPPTDNNNKEDTTSTDTWSKRPNATTVNLSAQKQLIRGFGAANILPWRPDLTDAEIQKAFGTGDGQLGFSILRLMIQENPDDWNMNVHTAKQAYDKGVFVFASPWNAPDKFLKQGAGADTVARDKYDEYAANLNNYYNYMKNNGIDLYAISVQNEPDYGKDWTGWSKDGMLTFMRENAGDIDTKVMAPESFQFRRSYTDPLLNDAQANANLDIVGGHIYGAGLKPYPLAHQKGKEVWMTEHFTDSDHSGNDWPLALDVGTEINRVLQAGMNAYVWWYIERFYGPIGDGEKGTTKGDITKRGYVMSQFSRFIRPGFHRIAATSNPQPDVYIGAYQGEDKLVITAINMSSTHKNQQFIVEDSDRQIDSLTPYATSKSKNVEPLEKVLVSKEHSSFMYDIPAKSIITFVEQ